MAAINFSKMRKQITGENVSEKVTEKSHEDTPAKSIEKSAAKEVAFQGQNEFVSSGVFDGSKFTKKMKIMESGFCYGCLHFSVDAPRSDREMGYCKRELKDGDYLFVFKRIKNEHLISQCPLIIKGDRIVGK